MAKRIDILINEDWSFQTFEGDLDCGESVLQDCRNVVYNSQGDWRRAPLLGVGIRSMLNAPIDAAIQRLIRLNSGADGISVSSISGDLENLKVNISNERF